MTAPSWKMIKSVQYRCCSVPLRAAEGGRGTPGGVGAGCWWGSPTSWCSGGTHTAPRGSTQPCSWGSSSRPPNRWPRLSLWPESAIQGRWCCSSASPTPHQSPGTDLLKHLEGDRRKRKQWCTALMSNPCERAVLWQHVGSSWSWYSAEVMTYFFR